MYCILITGVVSTGQCVGQILQCTISSIRNLDSPSLFFPAAVTSTLNKHLLVAPQIHNRVSASPMPIKPDTDSRHRAGAAVTRRRSPVPFERIYCITCVAVLYQKITSDLYRSLSGSHFPFFALALVLWNTLLCRPARDS
jgi:hypothetical protein